MGKERPGELSEQVNHRPDRGTEDPHQARITWQEATDAWSRLLDAARSEVRQPETPTGTTNGELAPKPRPPAHPKPLTRSTHEKENQS